MNKASAVRMALLIALGAVACGGAGAQEPLRQAPLPTYDATQLTPDRYTVIRRLWVDSWHSAFDVPTHPESGAALAQLSDEAVKVGADALTNVVCLNDDRAWLGKGYYCYGLAVKLR